MSPRAEDLRAIPLLSGLDVVALEKLAAGTSELEAYAGQPLTHPGATGTGMFFVVEGMVEVDAPEGHRELGPGEFFGEMGVLEKAKRNATVVAKTPMTLLTLNAWDVKRLEKKSPEAMRQLEEVIEQRRQSS